MKTTNKILSLILAVLMVMSIIPITASAATYSGTCGNNSTWTYDSSTFTLTISGTGSMYDYKTNNRPWESYEDKIKTVVIEDGVTAIGENAFYDCEKTINISISNSVISIGKAAFRYCEALENINIPDGITQISDNAFSGCLGLTEIIIPESVTKFGTNAFYNCDGLTEIIIPGSVTEIDEKAFYGCDGLTEIIIPDSVTTIGDYAFEFCSVLEYVSFGSGLTTIGTYAFANCNFKNISIPSNITSMGDGVFHGLKNLLSITVDSDNPYYMNDEYGVLYNKDKTTLIQYPIGSSATSYVIPDTVTTIGWRAFNECDSLTDIVLPDSVTTIGLYCFAYCDNLKKVTLGANVTTIDESAFYNPLSTIEFYYNGTSKQWEEMYNNQVEQKELIPYSYVVHCTDKDVYPKCGENVNWIFDFDTGVLKIFGTGDMDDIPYDERPGFYHYPWTYFANKIVEVIICDGVTSVGDNTTCGLENLTKATISYGVTRIGEAAFAGCENLTEITIPDSVTIIGKRAFGGCNNLSVVTMSKNVTEIGDKAFVNCTNLKSCVIPVTVTTLGEMAFYNCSGVTDVYYEGTEEQWSNFIIFTPSGTLNLYPPFKGATMHYNYHIHRNVLASKPVAPTCTEQGYTTYTCDCGDNYIDDYVEALGHSYTSEITIPATHTATGIETFACECGDTYTEVIEKLEKHNYDAVITAPTCTEQGYTTYTCECGDSYVDDYVDALGHDFNNGFCTNMDCAQLESASYTTNKYDIDGDTDLDAVYEISNAGQLYWFAEQVNEGNSNINAILLNDIVVNSGDLKNYDGTSANNWKVWSAIGVKRSFQGIFDGNGYCISGLYMNDDTTSGFGLFYTLDGEIRNLGIVNSYFSGKNTVGGICAGISDYKAKVIGCYSDATIFVSNGCAGGICAGSYGIIEKCYNTGSITSSDEMYIGGIVGYNLNSGRIKECYNTGTINGYKFVAGICGYDEGDEISNCYNEGAITGYMHIAGICGLNTAKVSKCYNSGTITGYEKVAGICGENTNVISNCYNVGDINGYVVYIGGICGVVLPDRTIEYCHNVGKVVGTGEGISCNVGAICGGGANASVKFCYYQENCVIDGKGIVQNGMGHHDVGTRPDIAGSTMCMSVEQFASGEICIALNGEKAGDETAIWKQNIGEYGYPTFNGKTVFCDCSKENYTNASQESYHNYKSTVAKEPTCSETGVMTYTCSCGDTYTEVIDKLAEHNYQAVITSPSCTEQGYTTYTCACGDSYVSDYVDALGHNPATAVEENYVAPTCTENGSKDVVVYCSVCNEEISRETVILEAIDHADNDCDGYCDADDELLDPTVECDCNCHKSGITKFFFNFVLFFQRIFGSNKSCDCGVVHY